MTTSIPFYDFGGEGPLVHFAHSNGYPPACFRQMIEPLLPYHRVTGICHRPLWPGSQPEEMDNWHLISDDMIRYFDQEGMRDIVGVGHSLGAVATMYAALKRPELFQYLILIEPVFLLPFILQMMRTNPDIVNEVPLVKSTLKRRNHWATKEMAFEHFRTKVVFKYWSDEALWDYVNHALHEDEMGEIVLAYSREWEVRFYSTPPFDVWDLLPTLFRPTLAIRGVESDALVPEAWQMWQELQPQATFVEIEQSGHMVPMERPQVVAKTILDFLQSVIGQPKIGQPKVGG